MRFPRAAERLVFNHDGVFRQHVLIVGENRDSARASILDGE